MKKNKKGQLDNILFENLSYQDLVLFIKSSYLTIISFFVFGLLLSYVYVAFEEKRIANIEKEKVYKSIGLIKIYNMYDPFFMGPQNQFATGPLGELTSAIFESTKSIEGSLKSGKFNTDEVLKGCNYESNDEFMDNVKIKTFHKKTYPNRNDKDLFYKLTVSNQSEPTAKKCFNLIIKEIMKMDRKHFAVIKKEFLGYKDQITKLTEDVYLLRKEKLKEISEFGSKNEAEIIRMIKKSKCNELSGKSYETCQSLSIYLPFEAMLNNLINSNDYYEKRIKENESLIKKIEYFIATGSKSLSQLVDFETVYSPFKEAILIRSRLEKYNYKIYFSVMFFIFGFLYSIFQHTFRRKR